MLKKTARIIVAISLLFSLAGCKETPETNIVEAKNLNNMLKIAKEPAKLDVETLPANFECDISNKSIHVHANARVHVLGSNFPIYRVKAIDFSQNMIDTVADVFLKDAVLYDQQNYEMSKDEVAYEIRLLKQLETAYDQNDMHDDYVSSLAQLQTQYNSAPEVVIHKTASTALVDYKANYSGSEYSYTGVDVGESSPSLNNGRCLYVRNNWSSSSVKGAEFMYCDNRRIKAPDRAEIILKDVTGMDSIDTMAEEKLSYTPQEAQTRAESLLDQLSLPYSVFDVLLVADSVKESDGSYPDTPSEYSYKVRCSRDVHGTGTVLFSVLSLVSNDDYTGSWAYEQLNITMDDNGVYRIDWVSPYEEQETLIKNASLLPYEDVFKIFSRAITYYQLPVDEAADVTNIDIEITDVYLGEQRILEQESIDSGLLIPVWCFFGTVRSVASDGSVQTIDTKVQANPIIVINAIDGTIIDPTKGY